MFRSRNAAPIETSRYGPPHSPRMAAARDVIAPRLASVREAVTPTVEVARERLAPYVDSAREVVTPHLDGARDRLAPAMETAIDTTRQVASERLLPAAEAARDRLAPVVHRATDTILDAVVPAVVAVRAGAPEARRNWPMSVALVLFGVAIGVLVGMRTRRRAPEPAWSPPATGAVGEETGASTSTIDGTVVVDITATEATHSEQ